jgi:hypothetical protein
VANLAKTNKTDNNAECAKRGEMENNLIKPHIAAQMLGVHSNTLRNWVAQGIISERRTPTNHRLFVRAEIETLKTQIETENRE